MFFFSVLMASLVVFPKQGAQLPAIDSCYFIGSVPNSETNVFVNGEFVPVYKTGGWVTMVKGLHSGTNAIEIVVGSRTNLHNFVVAKKPEKKSSAVKVVSVQAKSVNIAPAKEYLKLPYADDKPFIHSGDKKLSDCVVYIDPGHGGNDTGALSPHGFPEKDANLRVSFEVRRELEKSGIKVFMTRTNDVACALYDRPKDAHKMNADAFVSIHHNAPGYETDPRLVRHHCIYAWNELGDSLSQAINVKMDELLDEDIPNKGVLRANYAVTRSPQIPSCLIEVDFLTTPEGEEAIWCPPRRRAIGKAIADGIVMWLSDRLPKK